jgi:hypothetical protein
MDFPAMAFFEGLRRAPPAADALSDGQIRGLPLGGNQDEAICKPDGSGSTMMLLLSAHLAARQEIAYEASAHGYSPRSTSLNSSATHGHNNGGQAIVAQGRASSTHEAILNVPTESGQFGGFRWAPGPRPPTSIKSDINLSARLRTLTAARLRRSAPSLHPERSRHSSIGTPRECASDSCQALQSCGYRAAAR